MLKSKLLRFIVKRAALLLILLTAADLVFLKNNKWLVLAGLLAGAFLSIGRFLSNELILKKIFEFNGKKTIAGSIAFAVNQLVLLPVIALAYFLNIWILYGLIAGILAAPIIIMINSITEAFGITKNNFE